MQNVTVGSSFSETSSIVQAITDVKAEKDTKDLKEDKGGKNSTTLIQEREEKIPLLAEVEVEKKLAGILNQIQQNKVKELDLFPKTFGRFYDKVENVRTLLGHRDQVRCLTIFSNGTLASGSWDKTIKLWDTTSGCCLSTYNTRDEIYSLTPLSNGTLAFGLWDDTTKLSDRASSSYFSTFTRSSYKILALAKLPNGILVSGSKDHTIKLWNTNTGKCLSTLMGHNDYVAALAVLPDGTLASGSYDHTIKLWNTATGQYLSTFTGHSNSIFALVVLPNGTLVSGSRDHTIKLWNTTTGQCLSTLIGHNDYVAALAVLPNGTLVSGSYDYTIKLWDTTSGQCLLTFKGHNGAVYSLAVLPSGTIASGSKDNTIKLWNPKIVSFSVQYIQPILKALQNNISITRLGLSNNPDITDDIIDHLLSLLASITPYPFNPRIHMPLQTIDLRHTGVTKAGIEKLKKAISQLHSCSVTVLTDWQNETQMVSAPSMISKDTPQGPHQQVSAMQKTIQQLQNEVDDLKSFVKNSDEAWNKAVDAKDLHQIQKLISFGADSRYAEFLLPLLALRNLSEIKESKEASPQSNRILFRLEDLISKIREVLLMPVNKTIKRYRRNLIATIHEMCQAWLSQELPDGELKKSLDQRAIQIFQTLCKKRALPASVQFQLIQEIQGYEATDQLIQRGVQGLFARWRRNELSIDNQAFLTKVFVTEWTEWEKCLKTPSRMQLEVSALRSEINQLKQTLVAINRLSPGDTADTSLSTNPNSVWNQSVLMASSASFSADNAASFAATPTEKGP